MKFKQCIPALALIPLSVYAQFDNSAKAVIHSSVAAEKFTVQKVKSNESDLSMIAKKANRSIDVPTYIIRTEGDLTGQNLNCDDVTNVIDEKVLSFEHEDFTYNTFVSCSYNQNSKFARRFSINAYFDPLNDKAVAFLEKYLAEINGSDLFGTTLNIEPAKGLIIAINLMAGTLENPDRSPLILHGQDRSNFSFKSNYEMKNQFLTDVYENFYSDDPDKILPFLNRWIYQGAGFAFYNILSKSNYVELQPERIFLMDNDGDIFVSRLHYYFAHQCYNHNHHFCLKPR